MKKIPKISEAELEVMKVLWSKSPQTANEVIQALKGQMDWNPKTVRTLINRLVKKQVIFSQQKIGRTYMYGPLISRDDYLQVETKSFIKRFYGAALKPLIVNFLQEEKLSSKEIDELKRILDDKNKSNQKEEE
ncbi:BlaI/MecI/CopY family transcriptional regulator [Bacillus thuringiensis]|nr:BlaI/MecI/CopY family transcriptional regulator [Bacillus thuringiensis]